MSKGTEFECQILKLLNVLNRKDIELPNVLNRKKAEIQKLCMNRFLRIFGCLPLRSDNFIFIEEHVAIQMLKITRYDPFLCDSLRYFRSKSQDFTEKKRLNV